MTWDLCGRMLLAIAVGGLIGAERESRDKAAGFRTMTLICLGSSMFTILSIRIGGETNAARIAAQIVSGVGFLGAGAIMRDGSKVSGLTTAATVWLTASLGMGLGAGYVAISLTAAAMTLAVLLIFPLIEHRIDNRRESVTYELACSSRAILDRLVADLASSGLFATDRSILRSGTTFDVKLTAIGTHAQHEQLKDRWLADSEIDSIRC